MTQPRLSVVIPAYNEARRLPPTLDLVKAWLRAQPFESEIVVVDDGSRDGTGDLARAALADHRHQVLVHDKNRGKGAGIKTGMCAAAGEFVLFTDADLSTPMQEYAKFLAEHERGTPIVIGTRKSGGAQVLVAQSWLRRNMGRVFTLLSNALVCPGISDFTCGFKSFRADACRAIFTLQREEGWAYDSEVLFLARRLGFEVREIPVQWTNDPSTRVNLLRDSVGSLLGLVRIRARALRGGYGKAAGP